MTKNQGSQQSVSRDPEYCLPKDTTSVVASKIAQCANPGLLLTRYLPQQTMDRNATIDKESWKGYWLKKIAKQSIIEPQLILSNYARWQKQTKAAQHFSGTTQGRLIVGLGGKGVLETGLTLHHVTGLPIIPGSALKGVCRAYALYIIAASIGYKDDLMDLDEALGKGHDELKFPDAENFRAAFGSTEAAGECIFYDAVVENDPKQLFEVDVMTPHFPDYYQNSGKKPPSDDQSPVPISFMTVAANTQFAFAVGKRGNATDALVDWAVENLKKGLHELGIGAKTAAGYGVFNPKFEDSK